MQTEGAGSSFKHRYSDSTVGFPKFAQFTTSHCVFNAVLSGKHGASVYTNLHPVIFTTEEERITNCSQTEQPYWYCDCAAICNVMQFTQTSYYVYKDVTCRGATKSIDSRKLPSRKSRSEIPFFTNQTTSTLHLVSCIYTVHLTRSLNRQTNTCTHLVFLFMKTYLKFLKTLQIS